MDCCCFVEVVCKGCGEVIDEGVVGCCGIQCFDLCYWEMFDLFFVYQQGVLGVEGDDYFVGVYFVQVFGGMFGVFQGVYWQVVEQFVFGFVGDQVVYQWQLVCWYVVGGWCWVEDYCFVQCMGLVQYMVNCFQWVFQLVDYYLCLFQ